MELLELKSQKIIVSECKKQFLLPVLQTQDREISLDIEIGAEAIAELYVVGVLDVSKFSLQVNSRNTGQDSSFSANLRFVQFGTSVVDFDGFMKIENGAKNSSANLSVESLLLSREASANLVPSLEIEENEVSASHSALVKNIDQDQIFYMRSRGVGLQEANRLLVEGFVNSVGVQLPEEVVVKINKIIDTQFEKDSCLLNCEFCR